MTKPVAPSTRAAPARAPKPSATPSSATLRRAAGDRFGAGTARTDRPTLLPEVSVSSRGEWFSTGDSSWTSAPADRQVLEPRRGLTPLLGVPNRVLDPRTSYEANLERFQRDGVPRLARLPAGLRAVEAAFASQVEADPAHAVAGARLLAGDGDTQIFETDAVKRLFPGYGPGLDPATPDERRLRLRSNHALHPTAVMVARLAFLQRLDELAALPAGDVRRAVLVTGGGCAAGKGGLSDLVRRQEGPSTFGAVWDSAGESEGLENPWVLEACQARGLTVTFGFAAGDPTQTYAGVLERAELRGRVVDVDSFVASYVEGTRNLGAFLSSKAFQDAEARGQATAFAIDPGPFDPRSRRDPQLPEYPALRILGEGRGLRAQDLPALPPAATLRSQALVTLDAELSRLQTTGLHTADLEFGARFATLPAGAR